MSPSNKSGPFEGPQNGYTNENGSLRPSSPPKLAILIRKLPRNTTKEELNSMLLFTQDLISTDFVDSKDVGFSAALASFHTEERAWEAQAMLHGKPNSTRDATMIVEVLAPSASEPPRRRATLEQSSLGADIKALASNGPWGNSRYNEAFQPLDRISPTAKPGMTNGDSHKQDTAQAQGYFSPQSVGTSISGQSNTGKSVIGQDVDDETGKLIEDPVAFMRNDPQSMSYGTVSQGRRSTLPHIPTGRFANMSLNTSGMSSPQSSGVVSPRMGPLQSPTAFASPNMASMGPNASYQYTGPTYMRPNMPPVNPSDQNPPCNTLYVGNLPMDAAEDELKALFCKQRGYKRLCLRTKNNGPMCFVEFEDITCASKALTECYGLPLHNSTKGGIRLSFSKNPLGVRNGQPGSMSSPSPMSPHGPANGANGMSSYSAVNGPPPGLNPPPGLMGAGINGTSSNMGMASPNGASMHTGFSNPAMSPVGTALGQGNRPPSSAIGQGWNWPTREGRTADLPASMMGR